jgi:hypothetical protein
MTIDSVDNRFFERVLVVLKRAGCFGVFLRLIYVIFFNIFYEKSERIEKDIEIKRPAINETSLR